MSQEQLLAELAEYRQRLGERLADAIETAERDVQEWVWTAEGSARWSPFLYERERQGLPAEKLIKPPRRPKWVDASGYLGDMLRVVRCYDGSGLDQVVLREHRGDRTWHAQAQDGEVVAVGALEVDDGRLDRVTVVAGGQNVRWSMRQEQYTWCDDKLVRIHKTIAELSPDGLKAKSAIVEDLDLSYTGDGHLDRIALTLPSGAPATAYNRPESETSARQLQAELQQATVDAAQRALSQRADVAVACLAHSPGRPWPPDLVALTRDDVEEIMADGDRDVHDLSPAEWASSEVRLPWEEAGCDVDVAFQRISENDAQTPALAAVEGAARELANMPGLSEVVVFACDYTIEDEQLAEILDRVLGSDSPLRRLL